MSNKEILKKIQDSAIREYNKYKDRVSKLPGEDIFNMAGEIYAYDCIVSYFNGIEVEDDWDTRHGEILVELYGEDTPNNMISGLVNAYYDTSDIDLGYWGGVEELIQIVYNEETN